MTRTCEKILHIRHLSCKGIAQDLRIYGGLIVVLMIWSFLFFAVFVLIYVPAIMKVCCYLRGWNILRAKSLPISGRTGNLLRKIFGKFHIFPINHLSENLIIAQRRYLCHQYSHSTKFYGFYLIVHQPNHAWVILKI